MKKIYDYHKDEQIELYVLIKSADEKTTRTNKPYLSFVFQDISGEISANYWDATPKDVEMFKPGTVIKLEGKREEYKGVRKYVLNLYDRLGMTSRITLSYMWNVHR